MARQRRALGAFAIPVTRQIRLRSVKVMARCGIRFRYPVKILIVHDEGSSEEALVIGDAETLRQALSLAERQGFHVRDTDDGGTSKLVVKGEDGQTYFLLTVYPP